MTRRYLILLSFILNVCVGTAAIAYDFSEADALFKQRENNLTAISKARGLYEQALNRSLAREDALHAVEHLGKLAYYEGDLLLSQDESSKRVAIFSKCLEYVDNIHPNKIGQTGAYYYWKTTCLALWGRAAGMISASSRLGELKESMKLGLEVDPNYAGGGIHRVIASIKVRASWLSGLRDFNGALQQIDQAIAKGPEYYNAYVLKAEILKALDRENEALAVLETAKRELEKLDRATKLPVNLEPESRVFLKQLKEALRN